MSNFIVKVICILNQWGKGLCLSINLEISLREAWWPSGRASDSGARGWGFDPYSGRFVVSLSKLHLSPKSTGNT